MMIYRFIITIFLIPVFCFAQNQYLDTSFNGTGKFFLGTVFNYPNSNSEYITDAVEQPDGKVIFLGISHSNSGFFEPIYCTVFRLNTDGTLDDSFGNEGVFQYSTYQHQRNLFNVASKIVLQNDGSLLIAGVGYAVANNLNSDLIVMKLNANGSIDTFFGENGISRLPILIGNNLKINDMIVYNDVIYTAGRANSYAYIASINLDGSINTNFNGLGTLILDDTSLYYNDIKKLKIVSGKLLAIGISKDSSFNIRLSLARVFLDGSLDISYGTSGIATPALIGETNESILDYQLLPDDKLLTIIGGNFYQVNKYGLLDATFGTNGFIKNPYNESFLTATITADKKTILSKSIIDGPADIYQSFKTVRINSDFTKDAGYYNNGQVLTNVLAPEHYVQAPAKVLALSNGKTLVAGTVTTIPNPNVSSIKQQKYVVVRYTTAGTLQTQDTDKREFLTYPNPVKNTINFKTLEKVKKAEIYDLSGRLIKAESKIENNKIDASALKYGDYILKITTDKQVYHSKFIKE
ncbi:T9SS type A sorting domain-containing protein [Epilithonimonas xixisoli]|uniref:Putative delta-60 repeat protein/predicted secreted protein (Por secretion system target) n=1 Tax=Epilithonimonas xixisoli TaxID=1476462 RepID=A0A4R8I781_9FLAO|nr:T9SS type A sorting domain-containing protein [Epilithonimonas xixisoli]TDX84509.1 putative delta-60 repeat protein/predicted secreted protein (Por secretion system target) [Epilithonimonas xixisoli]